MGGLTPEGRHLNTQGWRESIVQAFVRVEDAVYAGLGTLLAAIALVLLVAEAVAFARGLVGGTLPDHAVELVDRILLILMIVELLYSVQVSFRAHGHRGLPRQSEKAAASRCRRPCRGD